MLLLPLFDDAASRDECESLSSNSASLSSSELAKYACMGLPVVANRLFLSIVPPLPREDAPPPPRGELDPPGGDGGGFAATNDDGPRCLGSLGS